MRMRLDGLSGSSCGMVSLVWRTFVRLCLTSGSDQPKQARALSSLCREMNVPRNEAAK